MKKFWSFYDTYFCSQFFSLSLSPSLCTGSTYINIKHVTVGIVLAQLISNDKFKSVTHRVLANREGPRISVACFFNTHQQVNRLYGPIKELLSDDNPPLYREIQVREYIVHYASKGLGNSALANFRLWILKEEN